MGGAAGPGKTLAGLMDQFAATQEFEDPKEAVQVHTLMLRRTFPKLEGSVIRTFREKFPREIYRSYNESKHEVTWLNGATTRFGAMQHDKDVWNYQGSQWMKIHMDETTEFSLYQWTTIQPWNRCPVNSHCTQDGSTNPVGPGATWVMQMFGCDGKGARAPREMDDNQRALFDPSDYEYIPATYLDNPVYAKDARFVATLEALPAAMRDALKYGIWGSSLGTYYDIWDPAEHTYEADTISIQPWWPKWVGGDWGFEHEACIYWCTLDPLGYIRVYRELAVNHHTPKKLIEAIVKASTAQDESGREYIEDLAIFPFSHDAFAERTGQSTIAQQMAEYLSEQGYTDFPRPYRETVDKVGGEQLIYSLLQERIRDGEFWPDGAPAPLPNMMPRLQIADTCTRLIETFPMAPRDEKKPEQIAKFNGDDPLDGARIALYGKLGRKAKLPNEHIIAQAMTSKDPTSRHLQHLMAVEKINKQAAGKVVRSRRWTPKRG